MPSLYQNGFWSLKSIEFFHELLAENDVIQVKIASIETCNDKRFDNKKYILDVFDGYFKRIRPALWIDHNF